MLQYAAVNSLVHRAMIAIGDAHGSGEHTAMEKDIITFSCEFFGSLF